MWFVGSVFMHEITGEYLSSIRRPSRGYLLPGDTARRRLKAPKLASDSLDGMKLTSFSHIPTETHVAYVS